MSDSRNERVQVRSKSTGLKQLAPKSWLRIYPDLELVDGKPAGGKTVGKKPPKAPKTTPVKASTTEGASHGSNTL